MTNKHERTSARARAHTHTHTHARTCDTRMCIWTRVLNRSLLPLQLDLHVQRNPKLPQKLEGKEYILNSTAKPFWDSLQALKGMCQPYTLNLNLNPKPKL